MRIASLTAFLVAAKPAGPMLGREAARRFEEALHVAHRRSAQALLRSHNDNGVVTLTFGRAA